MAALSGLSCCSKHWAEAHEKIAATSLTNDADRNWSSFQLANSAPPLSVTDSAIAPSARMQKFPVSDQNEKTMFLNFVQRDLYTSEIVTKKREKGKSEAVIGKQRKKG